MTNTADEAPASGAPVTEPAEQAPASGPPATDRAAAARQLSDWRRRVAEIYAAVRADPDPERAWLGWRAARDALFRDHPQSPVAAGPGFAGLPFADYDPAWRFLAPLLPAEPARLELPTGDGVVALDRVGRLELPCGGLDAWWVGGYGGGLFVPVADAGNGTASYGGGRYLIDTIKGADLGEHDGRLVVDLNFAYHPSCRYSPRWSCPLAPAGNRLAQTVPVGEQLR